MIPKTIVLLGAITLLLAPLNAQVEQFGSKRAKAPRGWTKLQWPEMRETLFGLYAPTDEEKGLIDKAIPRQATAKPAKERRILIFYRCSYPHASIATGVYAFQEMGKATTAYTADITDKPEDFTPENLANYDAVLLVNNVGYEKIIGERGCSALLEFVKSGKGLVGIHAAADACKTWPEGAEMMGGIFHCHPWLPKGTWAFQLESPEHPLNQSFKNQGFWLKDEIYAYRVGSHSRERSRVLVGLDLSKEHNLNSKDLHNKQHALAAAEKHRPVAWIHTVGEGRVFYSNFGHNNTTYWQPNILQHYLDGIQYALGDITADSTPSAKLSSEEIAPAPAN